MTETLDALVRRVDPDRWLAARFAGRRREDLSALYALNYELARVAETVSTPMLGEIRLAWWREGIAAGRREAHPVLAALSSLPGLEATLLEAMVEARAPDLEPAPFADEDALVAYIDATAGSLMAACARLLDPAAESAMVRGAARAWGWAGLGRSGPAWAAQGRRWTPLAWADADDADISAHVAHRVEAALDEAEEELRGLPVASFPAVAYATLARQYAHGSRPGELEKRVRLVAAVLRGRL
ncbi:MAG TPA: squalene/phytoene synthase family protein [Caulobacteraceae bacterium]|jgi:phytoene synthase|nr:squalene/phytoene synthase family protein [Caulobacteraceae bacterium]